MRRTVLLTFAAMFAPLFALGCGGSDSTTDGTSGGGGSPSADTLTFTTGEFEAPAGDSFTCFYLDAKTPKQLSVSGASGQQGPGGHHILIYYTDAPRSPEHHTCKDSEMVSWHQIAGSAGHDTSGAEGIINLPKGIAVKVPEGKQLVIQSHYINTSGKTEKVNDSVTIETIDPSEVKAYANYFATDDGTFEVPANGSLKSVSTCTVPQDLQVVFSLGHMHEWGTHFKIETVEGDGTESMIWDRVWQPLYASHPPVTYYSFDKPMLLKKGTQIRQTCEWDNTTTEPLTFPREMCVGFFGYYPDNGFLECDAQPVK